MGSVFAKNSNYPIIGFDLWLTFTNKKQRCIRKNSFLLESYFCTRFAVHFVITEFFLCLIFDSDNFLCSFLCIYVAWSKLKHIHAYQVLICSPKTLRSASTSHSVALWNIQEKSLKMKGFKTTHRPRF